MALKLGEAFVLATLNRTQLQTGLRGGERDVTRSVGRMQSSVTAGMRRMALSLGGGIGGAVILRSSIREALAFQEAMASVSTMVQDTSMHMDRFSDDIRQLSQEFGEATGSLAGGLFDILSASVAPERAIDVLRESAKAAKAGATDTKTAANAIITILNSYGLAADKAADVSDLLFSIVSRGVTTFGELAPNIGKVTSIAAAANVSLEELGALLAVMTRNGVRTEIAITALRSVISTFISPSKEAAEAAAAYGFELSSVTLQTEGLFGVLQKIQLLPPDLVAKIFPNVRALTGLLPALNDVAGFATDLEIMANRAGATEKAFAKMSATAGFGLSQIRQELNESLRVLGDALLPIVAQAAQMFAEWAAEVIGSGDGLRDVTGNIQEFVEGFGKIALVVGEGVIALTAASVALRAMALVMSPGGIVLVGLAALIGLFVDASLKGQTLKDSLEDITKAMLGVGDAGKAGLEETLDFAAKARETTRMTADPGRLQGLTAQIEQRIGKGEERGEALVDKIATLEEKLGGRERARELLEDPPESIFKVGQAQDVVRLRFAMKELERLEEGAEALRAAQSEIDIATVGISQGLEPPGVREARLAEEALAEQVLQIEPPGEDEISAIGADIGGALTRGLESVVAGSLERLRATIQGEATSAGESLLTRAGFLTPEVKKGAQQVADLFGLEAQPTGFGGALTRGLAQLRANVLTEEEKAADKAAAKARAAGKEPDEEVSLPNLGQQLARGFAFTLGRHPELLSLLPGGQTPIGAIAERTGIVTPEGDAATEITKGVADAAVAVAKDVEVVRKRQAPVPIQITDIRGLRDLGLSQQFRPDEPAQETADNTAKLLKELGKLLGVTVKLPEEIGEKVAENVGMTNEPAEGA